MKVLGRELAGPAALTATGLGLAVALTAARDATAQTADAVGEAERRINGWSVTPSLGYAGVFDDNALVRGTSDLLPTLCALTGVAPPDRPLDGIELKHRSSVQLKPGGMHVMLLGLQRPLKEGERIKLTLTFARAGTIEIEARVEKAGAMAPGDHQH